MKSAPRWRYHTLGSDNCFLSETPKPGVFGIGRMFTVAASLMTTAFLATSKTSWPSSPTSQALLPAGAGGGEGMSGDRVRWMHFYCRCHHVCVTPPTDDNITPEWQIGRVANVKSSLQSSYVFSYNMQFIFTAVSSVCTERESLGACRRCLGLKHPVLKEEAIKGWEGWRKTGLLTSMRQLRVQALRQDVNRASQSRPDLGTTDIPYLGCK